MSIRDHFELTNIQPKLVSELPCVKLIANWFSSSYFNYDFLANFITGTISQYLSRLLSYRKNSIQTETSLLQCRKPGV